MNPDVIETLRMQLRVARSQLHAWSQTRAKHVKQLQLKKLPPVNAQIANARAAVVAARAALKAALEA